MATEWCVAPGQLIRVQHDALDIRYTYRADKLRHKKVVANPFKNTTTTAVHHWDGQNMVMEASGEGGSVKARYLRGANLIAQQIDDQTHYYTHNAHGDVVQRTAQNGAAAPRYEYDAFGNQRSPVATDPNPFRYCGEYFDLSCGEYYLRARTYNPANGRFSSEDPARAGDNWYDYCGGNPVIKHDPLGKDAIWLNDYQGGFGPDGFKTGHSAVLLQDAEGVWYYANFGPDPSGEDKGTYTITALPDIPAENPIEYINENLSRLDAALAEQNGGNRNLNLSRYFSSGGDSVIQIRGDYSASVSAARGYAESQPKYNAAFFNCTTISYQILMTSQSWDMKLSMALHYTPIFVPNDTTAIINAVFKNQIVDTSSSSSSAASFIARVAQPTHTFTPLIGQNAPIVNSIGLRQPTQAMQGPPRSVIATRSQTGTNNKSQKTIKKR